MATRYQGKNLP